MFGIGIALIAVALGQSAIGNGGVVATVIGAAGIVVLIVDKFRNP